LREFAAAEMGAHDTNGTELSAEAVPANSRPQTITSSGIANSGEAFVPTYVYEAMKENKRFDSMRVGQVIMRYVSIAFIYRRFSRLLNSGVTKKMQKSSWDSSSKHCTRNCSTSSQDMKRGPSRVLVKTRRKYPISQRMKAKTKGKSLALSALLQEGMTDGWK
jgi:hypothetical protein